MPSTNKTPNIGLNQYLGNDYQKRLDYNSDMLKIDTAINEVSIFAKKTYAELKTLIDNNGLVEGKKYLLTDYRTKYQQPTTLVIKEMAVEQLVLTANSTNSFEPIVSSPTYPQDIITYNFNDNVCEDKTTPRTGFIQRRTDTITKNDCPQDWRTMLWARYKPDATQYYKDGVLTSTQIYLNGNAVMDILYKSGNSLYMAKNTNVPTSATDTNVFYQVYEDTNVGMLIEEKTKIADKIELKKGELHERLTFGNGCYRNYIGEIGNSLHNNVFGDDCLTNTLENGCYYNTFGNNFYNNYLGNGCNRNIIMNNCVSINFNGYCSRNIIGTNCGSNSFSSNCDNNILAYDCDDNSFDNNCNENILGSNCNRNSFGNTCYKNTLASNCTSNSFGNECYSNVFGYSCKNNSLSNFCHDNIFGNFCAANALGNSCAQNTFGNSLSNNIFGSFCILNKFSDGCGFNTFHNGCSANTLLSNFSHLFIKELYDKNITNISGLQGKTYNNTIEKNSNNQYVYWYLNSSNQPVYTVIP